MLRYAIRELIWEQERKINTNYTFFKLPFTSSNVLNNHSNSEKISEFHAALEKLTETHPNKKAILLVTDSASFIGVEFSLSDVNADVFTQNNYVRVLNDQVEGLFLDNKDRYVKIGKFSLVKYDITNSPWVFVPPRGVTLITEFTLQKNIVPHHYIVIKSRNENALRQRVKVLKDICLDKDIEIAPYSNRRGIFRKNNRVTQDLKTIANGGVMVNSVMGNPSSGFNIGTTVIGETKDVFLDIVNPGTSGLTSVLILSKNPEEEVEVTQPIWNFLKSLGSSHLHIGTHDSSLSNKLHRGAEEVIPLEVLTPGALSPFLLTGGDATSSIYSILRDFMDETRMEGGLINSINNSNADSFTNIFDYLKSLNYPDKNYLEYIFTKVYNAYKTSGSNYIKVLLADANSALYNYNEGNLSFTTPESWQVDADHEISGVEHRVITNILIQLLFYIKNRNTVMQPVHTTLIDNISHPALLSSHIFRNTLMKVMGEDESSPRGVLLLRGNPKFLPKGINPDIIVVKRDAVWGSLDLLKINNHSASSSLRGLKPNEVLVKDRNGRIEQVRLHPFN